MSKSLRVLMVLGVLLFVSIPAWARRHHHERRKEPVSDSDLARVAEPVAHEVCFSPEEPCGAKLIKFVLGAKKSLDIAVYDINLDPLVHQIALASRRLPVRVIVDQRQSHGEHSLVTTLIKAGVEVRYGRQRGVMHNKFIVRDGSMIETGSFNFTNHATVANNENQIYLDYPEVVARYVGRFNQIWERAVPAQLPFSSKNAAPEGGAATGPQSAAGEGTSGGASEANGEDFGDGL